MKTHVINLFVYIPTILFLLVIRGCSYPNSKANTKLAISEQSQKRPLIDTIIQTLLSNIKSEKEINKKYIRGIHLSVWACGSKKYMKTLTDLLDNTELNTVVIDIKEYEGKVYIDGVKTVNQNNAYVEAIPNLEKYISNLKEKGIYTIARIVVFRDNTMARKKPELAIKNPDYSTIWTDKKGSAWLDPYNKYTWTYNIDIAERATNIGFDEIQFDYIRFPSDGSTKDCRYSKPHSTTEASNALVGFLKEANKRLKAKGTKISIDVFGLTTTALDDMGIGQKIVEMSEWVDHVCPMIYPSHYEKWNYGIAEPNKEPYKLVYISLKGALKRIPKKKLCPWLQDFSIGYRYGKEEVRAQIQACYDNKIENWILWNPRCVYTKSALTPKEQNY